MLGETSVLSMPRYFDHSVILLYRSYSCRFVGFQTREKGRLAAEGLYSNDSLESNSPVKVNVLQCRRMKKDPAKPSAASPKVGSSVDPCSLAVDSPQSTLHPQHSPFNPDRRECRPKLSAIRYGHSPIKPRARPCTWPIHPEAMFSKACDSRLVCKSSLGRLTTLLQASIHASCSWKLHQPTWQALRSSNTPSQWLSKTTRSSFSRRMSKL